MKQLALALALTACSTVNQSTTPFVRDLHFHGVALSVERCQLDYSVDHREGTRAAVGVAQVMLLPLIVMGGGGIGDPGPSRDLDATRCQVDETVIPDAVAP